jgi:hypothetical protein
MIGQQLSQSLPQIRTMMMMILIISRALFVIFIAATPIPINSTTTQN